MNILVIGKPSKNLLALISQSKYTEKVYTATNDDVTELPNIAFRNFNELIQKAMALKIDIAINSDKALVAEGIAEAFEQSKINLISVNKKWLNLETSRLSAKKLLNHYKINIPAMLRLPMNFPIMIKTDAPGGDFTVFSMDELVSMMEELEGKITFYEECVRGEDFKLYSIWDRENIKYFHSEDSLTEVQKDRLDLLKTKLNFMFSDEKADFTGIFAVNLIWYKNDWLVDGFDMESDIPENILKSDKHFSGNVDFVYILNSAIYQKLGEI